jgi:hypothetical protein
MNEQQPYEKHLADKLHHLPPPGDIDGHWDQMKILLEKEMPRGGGIPNRRRWWILGVAIGILFLATWLSGEHFGEGKGPGDQVVNAAPAAKGGESKTIVPGKTDRPAGEQVPPRDEGYADAGAGKQPAAASEGTVADKDRPDKSRGEPVAAAGNEDASHLEKSVAKNYKNEKRTAVDEAIITPDNNNNSTRNKIKSLRSPKGKNTQKGNTTLLPDDAIASRREDGAAKDKGNKPGKNNDKLIVMSKAPDSKPAEENIRSSHVKAPLRYIDSKPAPALHPGPQIQKDYAVTSGLLPSRPALPATAAKKKITRSREAGTFAAGFTLPLAFPLGDQRAMGYNYWGGHNTVSDYLPSPQLQYHLNEKTFLQTEAQFLAPQFIRTTLLRNDISGQSGGYYTSHSTYARKLYYFNVPVSIHFSPFPGFYMGSGLQYSALLGGVISNEERKWSPGGANMLVKEEYGSFRKSAYSNMIRSDEFRLLLDANYYWNQFTVGLRYNQALTNYISFRLAPSTPYSFEKNRGLQFYMRYNLWEQAKGANNNKTKTLLTLK